MNPKILAFCIPLILQPVVGQSEEKKNEEGFKTSTVSEFLASKYKWGDEKEKAQPRVQVDNKTPFKTLEQRQAERNEEVEARLRPTLDIDDPAEQEEIPEDELGLDTVELREFQVNELYSPLMRMSELKDLETLDPRSGGAYLKEEYYSDFENRYLNRWHIPLIGKSQEQLAKERYQQEQYQSFLGEVSGTIEGLKNLNPQLAKELNKELRETQYQYNTNAKKDTDRFTSPDAKF